MGTEEEEVGGVVVVAFVCGWGGRNVDDRVVGCRVQQPGIAHSPGSPCLCLHHGNRGRMGISKALTFSLYGGDGWVRLERERVGCVGSLPQLLRSGDGGGEEGGLE